ncbi:MAG: hypothetical protein RJA41_274, partial [Actinomycetota bacterium]
RIKEDTSKTAVISPAVVLRDKTAEVKEFHKQTSNARGSWSGYSGAGARSNAGKSTDAGTSAGNRARIGAQKAVSSGLKKLDA